MSGEVWKVGGMKGEVPANWFHIDYDDSNWTDYVFLSPTLSFPGIHYYRLRFSSFSYFVAYEIRLFYQNGIIVYINGQKTIYDNMVTPDEDSAASGNYATLDYHSYIRSSSFFNSGNNVICVSLHWLPSETSKNHTTLFDAWIAAYRSSPRDRCYAYGYPMITTFFSDGQKEQDDVDYIWDLNRMTSWSTSGTTLEFFLRLTDSQTNFDQVSFYISPYIRGTPFKLSIYGYHGQGNYIEDTVDSDWDMLSYYEDPLYVPNEYNRFQMWPQHNYHLYRVLMQSVTSLIELYEMRVIICPDQQSSSFSYGVDTVDLVAFSSSLNLIPTITSVYNCFSDSVFPAGIVLTLACHIIGVARETGRFVINVSTVISSVTQTTQIVLNITPCEDAVVQIVRSYGSEQYLYESVLLIDMDTNQVVFQISENSGAHPDSTVIYSLCLPSTEYSLLMNSRHVPYWEHGSSIKILEMVHDEYLIVYEGRYDSRVGSPYISQFFLNTPFKANSEWFYHMNDFPGDMFGPEISSDWTSGRFGEYPDSANQIQVYKHVFDVVNVDLYNIVNVFVRFRFGCYVYLNGLYVYSKHASQILSEESTSTGSFVESQYVRFTQPIRMRWNLTRISVVRNGTNVITVIQLGPTKESTKSEFDCVIRFANQRTDNRVTEDASVRPSSVYPEVFLDEFGKHINGRRGIMNEITISYPHAAEEWINCVAVYPNRRVCTNDYGRSVPCNAPSSLRISALNEDTSLLVVLRDVSFYWHDSVQCIFLWLPETRHYNQFIFNFNYQDGAETDWEVSNIRLLAYNVKQFDRTLSYGPLNLTQGYFLPCAGPVYPRFIEFNAYNLPQGLHIDPTGGCIYGIPKYTGEGVIEVTAVDLHREQISTQVPYTVYTCNSTESILTRFKLIVGEVPQCYQWTLTNTVTQETVYRSSVVQYMFAHDEVTLCLPFSIYKITFEPYTESPLNRTVWNYPAYFSVTIFDGDVILLSQAFHRSDDPSAYFSNHIILTDTSKWKLNTQANTVPGNWAGVDYDDENWMVDSLANCDVSDVITIYARYLLDIHDLNKYTGIHFQMYFIGGIVLYFNGVMTARYNLPEDYTSSTLARMMHIYSNPVSHYVNLQLQGGKQGANVIALEIHRNINGKSSLGVGFRLICRYTVLDDGFVSNTVKSVELTDYIDFTYPLSDLFVSDYTSWSVISVLSGSEVNWELENELMVSFNCLSLVTSGGQGVSFALYGYQVTSVDQKPDGNEWHELIFVANATFLPNKRHIFQVPPARVGFRIFRLVFFSDRVDTAILRFHHIILGLLPTSMDSLEICSEDANYLPVYNGQIGAKFCDEYSNGFITRQCSYGVWGYDVCYSCILKLPQTIQYDIPEILVVNNSGILVSPQTKYTLTHFTVDPPLPDGLNIQEMEGSIWGSIQTVIDPAKTYTVYADNLQASRSTVISIRSRLAHCVSKNDNSTLPLEATEYSLCANYPQVLGFVTLQCVMGDTDGEWKSIQGMCIQDKVIVWIMWCTSFFASILIYSLFRCISIRKDISKKENLSVCWITEYKIGPI